MPKYEQILAHLGHFGLYVLMILVPLSGYLMSNSFGFPVHLFAIELPFLVEQNINTDSSSLSFIGFRLMV
jgi:cytochrome b561